MTAYRPISGRQGADAQPRSRAAVIAQPSSERDAVLAGVQAGDAARAHFDETGVLILFMEVWRSVEPSPRLEALRFYAELRRALLWRGQDIPATSLTAAGFTAAQIANFDATIAAIPPGTETPSVANVPLAQSEIVQ
jgi:hypothetical protein